jgi:diguanylate cyclase (GGDEF)-like protein
MREILETCVRIERTAERLYRDMAERCEHPAVADCLAKMGRDESTHATWWEDLIGSHDAGLLPDLWDDSSDARERVTETLEAVTSAVPPSGRLSGDEALAAAAAMELFLADQTFFDLLHFAGTGAADERDEEYDRHVRRLVAAIEEHGTGGIESLLGVQLQRAWRESRALAGAAARDPLTGLGNISAFKAHALQWSAWCARYGHPMSLLLLDLDHFRDVNETHGHEAGDTTLVAVADAVRAAVRASDVPARYGSDEFAILAPETGPEEARSLALRIADIVRDALVASEAGLVRPTVSIGIAVVLDPPDSEPRSIEEVTTSADRALYAAKQSGRDRVADPVMLAAVPA